MTNLKRTLFVFRQAPYTGTLAREGLEMALAMGALGQPGGILFLDDGVTQLQDQPPPSGMKNHTAMLKALPLYDVESCWVATASLSAHNLDQADLAIACETIHPHQLDELYAQFDHRIIF